MDEWFEKDKDEAELDMINIRRLDRGYVIFVNNKIYAYETKENLINQIKEIL